jgi:hypothetical protein
MLFPGRALPVPMLFHNDPFDKNHTSGEPRLQGSAIYSFARTNRQPRKPRIAPANSRAKTTARRNRPE